jgi:predicted metal-dependent enzyme (double-stranded beta helix superfamily)
VTSSLAFVLADLPTGDGDVLDRATLAAIVERVARRPSLWAARLDLRASVRTFASLHREPGLEVWAIAWLPESDTGWHDHDASSGAVHVVDGALDEHILRPGRRDRHSRYPAGHAFTFGPDHIHRVTCAGSRAVSVHAYSPALWRLGQYAVDGDGVLHRVTVSYADELRPVDASALAAG